MYIIETFRGEVKIDPDELVQLKENMGKDMIFFRQGAVNPKQIVRVVKDLARQMDVPKMVNESEQDYQLRLMDQKSEDIFQSIREPLQPTLANGDKRLLP